MIEVGRKTITKPGLYAYLSAMIFFKFITSVHASQRTNHVRFQFLMKSSIFVVMEFISQNISDNLQIAEKIIQLFPNNHVFAFYGEMGAGKTTLIKDFCKALGVEGNTSSPTFALVNEYKTETGKTIYHFDMYRIDDPKEAVRIGFDEYLESGNYCFIEWPEKIMKLLPESFVQVRVQLTPEFHRIISARKNDSL